MKKTTLNIVPINNVVFPHQTIKLFIPPNSLFFKKNLLGTFLGICFQKHPARKYSLFSYLTDVGIIIKVTDEDTEVNPATKKAQKMIRGAALGRFHVKHFISKLNPYSAEVELLSDEASLEKDELSLNDSIVCRLRDLAYKYISYINRNDMMASTRLESIQSEKNIIKLHYIVASYLLIPDEEKCKLLEIHSIKERIKSITQILEEELCRVGESLDIERRKSSVYRQRASPFPQLSDKELNSPVIDEMETLKAKLQTAELPGNVSELASRELNRLKQMEQKDPDFNIQKRYLEIIADLPWNISSDEMKDIDFAEKTLNKAHAGLESVKRRILEFIAVRILNPDSKGAILCLHGPPGIGKTSLGKSIAESLGKKFVRVALGGVRDEAEIRGHRRTYVGAMPGVFIDAMLKTKTNNPVILLDEIDKVGSNKNNGDPSAALLEVLDPSQNYGFQDHYLGIPFNLSNVLFIATANSLDTIQPPLLDRMEIISLSGYTQFEKVEIAKTHLIPKQIKENGIQPSSVDFTDASVSYIIKHYTSEAGVRTLERTIGSVCRKIALRVLKAQSKQKGGSSPLITITEKFIEEALGPKMFDENIRQRIDQPGIAIGLAWTQFGGKTLLVETSKSLGKGEIQITGQLGDVMKESVITGLGWIKSHKEILTLIASKASKHTAISNLNQTLLSEYDIHIHFPAASIPKDGPSAGVTIVTALISLLTEVKVRDNIAMTGEISLKGNVLAVGGIKEKCLAAYTSGIRNVILPEQNRANIEEIPLEIQKNIQ